MPNPAIQVVPIDQVHLNDDNPRLLKDARFEQLVKSIQEFPEMLNLRPLVIDEAGIVLGGNMRLRALQHLGYTEVPVMQALDLSEEQKREFIIKDNGSFGEWDWDALANGDWPEASVLNDWGINLPADWGPVVEVAPAEEPEPNLFVPSAPVTVRGDLYELNGHRLHCADSTDTDAVAKLLDGQQIDICFTSPPYNQGGGGMKYDYQGEQKALYKHKDDKRTPEEYFDFLIDVLTAIYVHCTDAAPVLWNVAYNANARDDYGRIVFSDTHGFTVRETIVWDKGHGFPSASKGILSRRAEFVFLLAKGEKYFTNQGENEPWFNFWAISSQGSQTEDHAAAFPIALPTEGLLKFSPEGALVYEPFSGTGTTLLASEQLGRRCYAQEYDEAYCDVTVRRWMRYMQENEREFSIRRNGVPLTETQLAEFVR
jgi:DNA modification methylase